MEIAPQPESYITIPPEEPVRGQGRDVCPLIVSDQAQIRQIDFVRLFRDDIKRLPSRHHGSPVAMVDLRWAKRLVLAVSIFPQSRLPGRDASVVYSSGA